MHWMHQKSTPKGRAGQSTMACVSQSGHSGDMHDCHCWLDSASTRQQQRVMALLSTSKATLVSHSRLCICSEQSIKRVGQNPVCKLSDLMFADLTLLTSTSYLCRLLVSVCLLYNTSLLVAALLVGSQASCCLGRVDRPSDPVLSSRGQKSSSNHNVC